MCDINMSTFDNGELTLLGKGRVEFFVGGLLPLWSGCRFVVLMLRAYAWLRYFINLLKDRGVNWLHFAIQV